MVSLSPLANMCMPGKSSVLAPLSHTDFPLGDYMSHSAMSKTVICTGGLTCYLILNVVYQYLHIRLLELFGWNL